MKVHFKLPECTSKIKKKKLYFLCWSICSWFCAVLSVWLPFFKSRTLNTEQIFRRLERVVLNGPTGLRHSSTRVHIPYPASPHSFSSPLHAFGYRVTIIKCIHQLSSLNKTPNNSTIFFSRHAHASFFLCVHVTHH